MITAHLHHSFTESDFAVIQEVVESLEFFDPAYNGEEVILLEDDHTWIDDADPMRGQALQVE